MEQGPEFFPVLEKPRVVAGRLAPTTPGTFIVLSL